MRAEGGSSFSLRVAIDAEASSTVGGSLGGGSMGLLGVGVHRLGSATYYRSMTRFEARIARLALASRVS